MPVAAVPSYLGTDFSSASPGLRFGMYLPLWGVDSRSGELLWTTHDLNYRETGNPPRERQFPDVNKASAWKDALELNNDDRKRLTALAARQQALAAPLVATGRLHAVDGRSVAPFTTGLGNEHPLENGFAFLGPYGLPYLPGSGVKGVLRQAARELARGEWGDAQGWSEAPAHILAVGGGASLALSTIDVLFGRETDAGDREHVRGALSFWDVLPRIEGGALRLDVMTPHQTHYHQQAESPHESGQPNPINFLTVPPGSGFTFHVDCDRARLQRSAPALAEDGRWQALLDAAFAHAFHWVGFGAKTAVGYGAMAPDARARQARVEAARAEQARREADEAQDRRRKELEEMPPVARQLAEFFDARQDRNATELSTLFTALKRGQWSGETKLAAAARVQALMQQAKKWKERTEKRNPEKDHDYQDTLLVLGWLKGK